MPILNSNNVTVENILASNNSTQTAKIIDFEANVKKAPQARLKKGRSFSSFAKKWKEDPEKNAALPEARGWMAEVLSKNGEPQTLRTLRLQKGLSQHQLGELIGVRQSNVARLEKGRHSPNLDMLRKLSQALGVDINTLDLAMLNCEKIMERKLEK